MTEEVKYRGISIVTIAWIATLTAILTCIGNLLIYFLPSIAYCNLNIGDQISIPGVDMLGWPFAVILVTMLLANIQTVRKYLSAEHMLYLYIAGLAASSFCTPDSPWGLTFAPIVMKATTPENIAQYVPEFIAVRREIAEMLITGTRSITAIPWSELFPAMIWQFLITALFLGISIGLVSIFRRQWVDVEMLPYPQVTLAHASILSIESIRRPKWPGKAPFAIGFLVGFILALIRTCTTFFPWFPDIYMWRSNTCGPGSHWITLPGTPWNLGLAKHSPLYALMMLIPVHYLFSIAFYGLVFEAALLASYNMGYYTGMADAGFCGRTWCRDIAPYYTAPLNMGMVNLGVMLGVAVMVLLREWRHILTTLRMAFSGGGLTNVEEPMSYRAAWTIFLASLILMVVFFIGSGLNPWLSFIITIVGVATWLVTHELWARIGFSNEPANFSPALVRLLVWPTATPAVTSTDPVLYSMITVQWAGHRPSVSWPTTMYTISGSYKMAKLTGTHPKTAVTVATTSLITAMIVAYIMQIALPGVYGRAASNAPTATSYEWIINMQLNRPVPGAIVEGLPWMMIGFVFLVVVRYVSARFLWIPDPIMAIIAWDYIGSLHGLVLAALICWIIKSIVLRIGGSSLYERLVVPFVGGFILGDILDVLLTDVAGLMMFPPAL